MTNCCDNRNTVAPICGFAGYQNLGSVCVGGQVEFAGNGPVERHQYSGSSNNAIYLACAVRCRARTAAAYAASNNACRISYRPVGLQSAHFSTADVTDCTAVEIDVYMDRDGANNCFLQGNQVGQMGASNNPYRVGDVPGTCQQIDNALDYSKYRKYTANGS